MQKLSRYLVVGILGFIQIAIFATGTPALAKKHCVDVGPKVILAGNCKYAGKVEAFPKLKKLCGFKRSQLRSFESFDMSVRFLSRETTKKVYKYSNKPGCKASWRVCTTCTLTGK